VLLIDNIAAEPARKMLADSLIACFDQGRVAVRDWRAMLATLKMARDQLARVRRAASTSPRISPSSTGWPTIISPFWARANYRLLPPDGKGQWRTWPPGPDQR